MIWDLVIITARSAQQRWLFERYLRQLWPASHGRRAPRYLVVQDPTGAQLGTAGATLNALCTAAEQLGDDFSRFRLLLLHCGGLSQRVPQLSHLGKAFAPSAPPNDDLPLFAQIATEMDQLFHAMEPGVVIACGDVLYTTASLGIACRREDAVAVACRASAEQGSRHGVYLWKPGEDRVSEAWQKPPAGRLRELDAGQPWGLDTGIIYLGAAVVEQVVRSVGAPSPETARSAFLRRKREWRGIELYRDLTPPLTPAWRDDQRLPGAPGETQRALSRFTLRLTCPEPAELRHFGTNQELIQILGDGGAPRVYSSYLAAGTLGAGTVIDRCLAELPIRVGAGSYVSGLSQSRRELAIAAGRVAYQLPLRTNPTERQSRVFVALGVGDDAKCPADQGATLLGEPLPDWLHDLAVSPELVWEGIPRPERCLWNARLFPLGEDETIIEAVPWLGETGDGRLGERVDRWRRLPRTSMAEASRLFDARRWWTHEQAIRARCYAARLEMAVRAGDGPCISELLHSPEVTAAARAQARRRLQALGLSAPASLMGARAWLVASALAVAPASRLRERGLRVLSRTLVRRLAHGNAELAWQIPPEEGVAAEAPVRVDLAGGWTDTPPQACERGGAVLNLALQLEGRRPLAARVERLSAPRVELVAADLGVRRVFSANPPARQRPDPRDPLGIHIGALHLIGIFGGEPLPERLRRMGGGLRLTTAAEVPKGSGLGTSSILGAVVLAALSRAFGLSLTRDDLCRGVLRLEQWMGTGGGWQDQVGGMWGGVKFARSAPGLDQAPWVEPLALNETVRHELGERMVLFYTGEPRLARDVLQRVVSRYMQGEPATLAALDEMPGLAKQAQLALLHGDWPALGRCIDRSWALNRQLEPSTSNAALVQLFERIAPFVFGAKLAGAGGGGFLFALARDRASRERLEALLAALPSPARLYPASFDLDGITLLNS